MLETVTGEQAAHIFLPQLRLSGGSLPYLRQLALRFAEFPYENISKIIKVSQAASPAEALRLPTEVVTDHIDRNFGGTCFSLTFLFERLLKAVGFECYKVMADMHSGRNVHCLVVVREGGAGYIVDPGYALYEVIALPEGPPVLAGRQAGGSGASGRGASLLGASERVRCPHAVVEVERASGPGGGPGEPGAPAEPAAYDLWTEDASGRKWRYRFVDTPASDAEFEAHWLESFSKPTLNNICLTRMTPRGHIYLRKDFFKFTSPTAVEKRRLAQGRERVIEEEFGIRGEWVEVAQRFLDERRSGARRVAEKRSGRAARG
jgi:arylamine N-acetyltransferase